MRKKVIQKKKTPSKQATKKTVVVKSKGDRPLPKGVQNDEERLKERQSNRRSDGTFKPGSAYKGVSAADVHMQNFDLKQAFLETFKLLGGVEELANWAAYSNSNQTEFYKILARMLPREMSVTGGDIEPNNLTALEDKELDAIINRHISRK